MALYSTTVAQAIRSLAAEYVSTKRVGLAHSSWVRDDPALDADDVLHEAFLRGIADDRDAPAADPRALLACRARSAARDAGRRIPIRRPAHAVFTQWIDAARVHHTPEQLVARHAIKQWVASLLVELSSAEARSVRAFLENGGERPGHWRAGDRRAFLRAVDRMRERASPDLRELFLFATT